MHLDRSICQKYSDYVIYFHVSLLGAAGLTASSYPIIGHGMPLTKRPLSVFYELLVEKLKSNTLSVLEFDEGNHTPRKQKLLNTEMSHYISDASEGLVKVGIKMT